VTLLLHELKEIFSPKIFCVFPQTWLQVFLSSVNFVWSFYFYCVFLNGVHALLNNNKKLFVCQLIVST
jgi:hypothetical protein